MPETNSFAHWSLKNVPLTISVCTQCGHFVGATSDGKLLAVVDRAHQCSSGAAGSVAAH
jgi:hypothetical protein